MTRQDAEILKQRGLSLQGSKRDVAKIADQPNKSQENAKNALNNDPNNEKLIDETIAQEIQISNQTKILGKRNRNINDQ